MTQSTLTSAQTPGTPQGSAPAASATAPAASRSPWSGHPEAEETRRWTEIAETVAAQLAEDVLTRDAAGGDPFDSVRLLKDSGLTRLLAPAEYGGHGGHWSTAFRVVRILARTDASLAQVLAYHYNNEESIVFSGDPEVRETWYRRSTAGAWVWGDAVNPVDPDLTLTDTGAGLVLSGTKRFCTGSGVGDALLVLARISGGPRDGRLHHVVLEHDRAGVEHHDDWDLLGQRQSSSGSVTFHDVTVSPEDELGGVDDPFSTLVTPAIQLSFVNLYVGIAEGALARGREITNARKNAWFRSEADLYRHDPFVLRLYGELTSQTAAAAALADQVAQEFEEVIGQGDAVTPEARGELAVRIAQAKVVSDAAGLAAAHQVYEATGSSSTRAGVGLDLFWRNIRTHSLHDPVDYRKHEVGDRFLNGTLPPVSLYT
jgi:alkylation response protein AidB-like acyl-CoA dehydrogenase